MKKKLLALVCALALVFSLAGCTISTPDTVGKIGDFEVTSGMYLLAQYGAYHQAAQLAGTDQDATDVKAFLKETITTDSDSGDTAVVSDYVADQTQKTLETLAAVDARAGADVDDVVRRAHRVLVVLDDNERVAEVAQALERCKEFVIVALVQSDGRLVEDIEHAHQA